MGMFSLGQAMGQAIGALAGGARARPGGREAGTFEDGFFAVPAPGETERLLHAARRTLDAARHLRRAARAGTHTLSASERAIATLTDSAVRVYEEILALARVNRGRVFPTYDHLARATGLARATVARALPVLERIGFLVRQRRFRRLAADGQAGPQRAQTSNVYRACLPERVRACLPRWMRPAPPPDDAAHRTADAAAQTHAMRAALSCRDLACVTADGALGAALERFGATLDRMRESQGEPQS